MANDSRSVGRPTNSPGRMDPRSVPVQHDKARINDQRKVRPHSPGSPPMGVLPSHPGAQKEPRKPRLNKEYMGMRDVPVERVTESPMDHEDVPWAAPPRMSRSPLPVDREDVPWASPGEEEMPPSRKSHSMMPQLGDPRRHARVRPNMPSLYRPEPERGGPEMPMHSSGTFTQQMEPAGEPFINATHHMAPEPAPAAHDPRMPLPGMSVDKIDEFLMKAREAGVPGAKRWTPDVIRAASELNRRQAAAKIMHSKHVGGNSLGEGYPDTSFERDEPAHEARIGDLGWAGNPYEPQPPALNREYAQFCELPVEKIHEMAEAEMTDLILRTAARLGFKNLSEEDDHRIDWHPGLEKARQESRMADKARRLRQQDPDDPSERRPQNENAVPRTRCRWVGEADHGLPQPKRPLPPNIAGSGKNFHVKPGTNKAKKQPGPLPGSGKAMKVKPGFIG